MKEKRTASPTHDSRLGIFDPAQMVNIRAQTLQPNRVRAAGVPEPDDCATVRRAAEAVRRAHC
jgi:hypothetical protein